MRKVPPGSDVVGRAGTGRVVLGKAAGWGFAVASCFADVAVIGTVVVEVIVELVGDVGELTEEIVGVLFAAGFAGVSEEILDPLVALVEELDEDEDAIVGDVSRVAELLDLRFREGIVAAL